MLESTKAQACSDGLAARKVVGLVRRLWRGSHLTGRPIGPPQKEHTSRGVFVCHPLRFAAGTPFQRIASSNQHKTPYNMLRS